MRREARESPEEFPFKLEVNHCGERGLRFTRAPASIGFDNEAK